MYTYKKILLTRKKKSPSNILKSKIMKFLRSFVVLLAVITANSIYAQNTENVTVVQLSQVEGQYENTSLALTPGRYIFEVTNKNVAKKLGFYLTPTSDAKAQITNIAVP